MTTSVDLMLNLLKLIEQYAIDGNYHAYTTARGITVCNFYLTWRDSAELLLDSLEKSTDPNLEELRAHYNRINNYKEKIKDTYKRLTQIEASGYIELDEILAELTDNRNRELRRLAEQIIENPELLEGIENSVGEEAEDWPEE